MNEQMMNHMFRVQIAMFAHAVHNAYREAVGEKSFPPFAELSAEWQDDLLQDVDFWLAHPNGHPSACHDAWLAKAINDGWRLGESVDPVNKISPSIRPFDTLPQTVQIKHHLFRGAVAGVTRTQSEIPAYAERIELINVAIDREYGHIEPLEERRRLWNLRTEEERLAMVDAVRTERDKIVAENNARRDRIMAALEHFKLSPEKWMSLTEEERVAKLDEHGAITGQGDWYSPEVKAKMAAELAAQNVEPAVEVVDAPNPTPVVAAVAQEQPVNVEAPPIIAVEPAVEPAVEVANTDGMAPVVESGPLEAQDGPVAGDVK